MNKTTKILIIILSIILAIGLMGVLIGVVVPRYFATDSSNGWQQRRLDQILQEHALTISAAETRMSATKLINGYDDVPLSRNDYKASGDWLDGSPASVRLSKKVAINETIASARDKITSSLISQGYVVDTFQLYECYELGALSSATKNGMKFDIRIERNRDTCGSMLGEKDESLWNTPASTASLEASIGYNGLN